MSRRIPIIPSCGIVLLGWFLGACSSVPMLPLAPYKMDIQQGNFVTQDMIAKLQLGMTRSQVRFALGTPLMVDPFRNDRWDYVYLYMKAGEITGQRRLKVLFREDKLVRVEGEGVPVALMAAPVDKPAASAAPTDKPAASAAPTDKPAASAAPTDKPAASAAPTDKPAVSAAPTDKPTVPAAPADKPAASAAPTDKPVVPAAPADKPTASITPTDKPAVPAAPTDKPVVPAAPAQPVDPALIPPAGG